MITLHLSRFRLNDGASEVEVRCAIRIKAFDTRCVGGLKRGLNHSPTQG